MDVATINSILPPDPDSVANTIIVEETLNKDI